MDASDEYIKMCDCPEIQGQRNGFTSGDLDELWVKNGKVRSYNSACYVGKGLGWLPRQDQLIEMLPKIDWELRKSGSSWFEMFIYSSTVVVGKTQAPTMEQCLLQFFMVTVYEKKWNGEVWVK